MAKGFNLKAIFSADTKDIERGSTKATESVKKFERDSKAALDGFDKGASVAGKKAQILGKNISQLALRFAGAAVSIRSFISAVKTIATFEKANSNLAAILGTTLGKIKQLTDSAIELGRKTEYTATQVTELQTELAKLGFSEPQILSMQESVLKFAAAVGTDLASAAARAGATMRGFDLSVEDTNELLAVMAVSTSKSALSFGYLDETLGKVIPVTKVFGLDAKSTVSLLGAMANAGIDASSAGTALRRIMAELSNSGSKLNATLGRQPKTMEDVIAALKELRDRGIGVTEAFDLVGKYSGATFLALVNGADDVQTLYGELQNCDEALNDMYETMTDNVEGAVKQLQSAWEGFILSMRQSQGPIKTVILLLRDMVSEANRILFKGTRDAEAKSKYTSILGGILERDGIDAVRKFVEEETAILNAEIEKKNKRKNIAKLAGPLGVFNVADAAADVNQYESMLDGLNQALISVEEQALKTGGSLEGVTGNGGSGGSNGKTGGREGKKSSDGLAKLQQEAREYAAAEQEVIEADKEMEAEGARLYAQFRALHPEISGRADDTVILARKIAALVAGDQEATSATNQYAEQLYKLADAFDAVTYAAGLTDEQLTEEVNKLFDDWADDGIQAMQEMSEMFANGLKEALMDAMEDTLRNLGTFIGDAMTVGFDTAASNLGTNMLDTLGTLVERVGELCLAVGEGVFAIDESLGSLNPYVALAAGAMLVALGAAVKSAASNLTSSVSSYSSSRSLADSYSPNASGDLETRTLNIRVTGYLTGDGRALKGVIQDAETVTNHTT